MYKYKAIKVNGKKYDEHRYIMEQHLGRKLKRHEVVHHIDGNTYNNNVDNLKLTTLKEHSRFHMKGRRPNINKEDLIKNGRKNRPAAKLTIDDVKVMRKMFRDKISVKLIAFIYQLNVRTVYRIKANERWGWV